MSHKIGMPPKSGTTFAHRADALSTHPIASPAGAELAGLRSRLDRLRPTFGEKAALAAEQIKAIIEKEPDPVRRSALERLSKKFRNEKIYPRTPREEAAMMDAGELMEWQERGLKFEKPHGSVMHHFFDALDRGEVRFLLPDMGGKIYDSAIDSKVDTEAVHSFVIEHDWSSAFKNATDFDTGAYKTPYPSCCFEFRISGKQVIAMAQDDMPERDFTRTLMIFVRASSGWVLPQFAYGISDDGLWRPTTRMVDGGPKLTDHFYPLLNLIAGQIRAVCITLEANVATTDVVRASHKLNHSRERSGRHPVSDYHVVRLAHRKRYNAVPEEMRSTDGRNSPRLHFRRGHDRHYQNYKVWIKWQLIGDPDLGFVDKEYRL